MKMTPLKLLLLASLLAPLTLHAVEVSSETSTEVEAGYTQDTLDKGYANWSSLYLDASHRLRTRQSIYGELRETRRFDLRDREVSVGYYHPLNETWAGLIEASLSPEHNVLPKYALFGQLKKTLDSGWNMQAGVRHSRYNTASSDLMVLTGERYWGSFRGAYTLYLGKPQGAPTASSHAGQLSFYYAERNSVTLGLTQGRQVENLGSGIGLLITEVSSASLSGRHWLNADWGISYEATLEHQGSLYSRKGARFGLRRVF